MKIKTSDNHFFSNFWSVSDYFLKACAFYSESESSFIKTGLTSQTKEVRYNISGDLDWRVSKFPDTMIGEGT